MTEQERKVEELEKKIKELEENNKKKIEISYVEDTIPGKLNNAVNRAQEEIEKITPEKKENAIKVAIVIVLVLFLSPIFFLVSMITIGAIMK